MNDRKNITIEFGSVNTILFVVFLVLKLCHVIDWSWWWVTAPVWIPICLLILIGLIVLLIIFINYLRVKHYEHKLNKSLHRRYK